MGIINSGRLAKWFYSCNHKDIGTLYLISGAWSGIVGTGLSIIIRLELGRGGSLIGDDQVYNVVVTAHAFVIIFLWLYQFSLGGSEIGWYLLCLGSRYSISPFKQYKILVSSPCFNSSFIQRACRVWCRNWVDCVPPIKGKLVPLRGLRGLRNFLFALSGCFISLRGCKLHE